MEAILKKPSLRDQQVASASLPHFASWHQAPATKRCRQVEIRLPEHEEAVIIPRQALELLEVILAQMAQGKTVSLLPSDSDLSTQEAADLLRVSRPHLVKLLEQGLIPFKLVGTHRRVQLAQVVAYAQQQAAQRQEHLQFLARQAQELQLGYE